MKDKKLQVFISSTFIDLIEERQAAVEAILSSGHIPAGMELFTAGDESQMTVIERWIDESDVYLLILGGRYGSIDKKTGKSYIQLEYEYALKNKKPMFSVVISNDGIDEKVKKSGRKVIEQDNSKELNQFRQIVLSNVIKFFSDCKDIRIAIYETLAEYSYRQDLAGWIKGDNALNIAPLLEEVTRLSKENATLRSTIESSGLNATYCGLSFDQLKNLLIAESIGVSQGEISLFDYFFTVAVDLIRSVGERQINIIAFEKLFRFKLVFVIPITEYKIGMQKRYQITEDGHNFYLRMLAEKSKSL